MYQWRTHSVLAANNYVDQAVLVHFTGYNTQAHLQGRSWAGIEPTCPHDAAQHKGCVQSKGNESAPSAGEAPPRRKGDFGPTHDDAFLSNHTDDMVMPFRATHVSETFTEHGAGHWGKRPLVQ